MNVKLWSSLVEGGEGLYLPNYQTYLVIALDALSLLFCIFINTTAYHLGRYEPSPPSTKELHGQTYMEYCYVGRYVLRQNFRYSISTTIYHLDALKSSLY